MKCILNCETCGKEILRTKSEIKKSKTGNHFCNSSCSSKFSNKNRYRNLKIVSDTFKVCIGCEAKFPLWMTVDGKKKVLNKRKYCISCQPLGEKYKTITPIQIKCPKCNLFIFIEEGREALVLIASSVQIFKRWKDNKH